MSELATEILRDTLSEVEDLLMQTRLYSPDWSPEVYVVVAAFFSFSALPKDDQTGKMGLSIAVAVSGIRRPPRKSLCLSHVLSRTVASLSYNYLYVNRPIDKEN